MAEYSNLSATINAQIRANGVQAITGPVLNAVLTAMVNVLGDGYRLNGVAVPADNPGSPDNRVAYLAAQDGTYTNFGGLTISGEVALLLWDSAWTKEVLFSIDTAVTPGSGHLVTSGAVDDALTTLAGNIAAAYMQLVPGATEDNLASYDNAGQVKDSGIAAADVVKKDGVYPDLFAGYAGNLVDTRSAGTPQGPYAFRQSGGDGVDYMVRIKGRTLSWNQKLTHPSSASSTTKDDLVITTNTDGSYHIEGTAAADGSVVLREIYNMPAGSRKVLVKGVKGASATTYWLTYGNIAITVFNDDIYSNVYGNQISVIFNYKADAVIDVDVWPQIFDLTLMGIASEISTPADFIALHPLPYYNYNAGVLKNNAATGIKSRGFNHWDEVWEKGGISSMGDNQSGDGIRSKNYNPAFPNTTYFINDPSALYVVYFYDVNKRLIPYTGSRAYANGYNGGATPFTTPAGTAYFRFRTANQYGNVYNNDICINLSDASRNGEYEPYWEREIVLGLDNLACHDEDDNAVVVNGLDGVGTSYDEAVVENGMVTKIIKRRGRRAYQAGDESDATLITDGTNTDYPLATPLTLTVDTPFPAFVEVDNLGTQERLPADTADNPQGGFESDSNYSVSTANLVRLLNL